jgi:diacylglycerol kinase
MEELRRRFEPARHKRKEEPFSIISRIKSFKYAYAGLVDILKTEHNAWVHAVVTVIVLLLSWWLQLEFVRFSLLLLIIISVWVAEAFNTVIEMLCDIVSPEHTDFAKRAKDIAGAAVLMAAIGAVILGLVVLSPPLIERLKNIF